ncbi:MAG: IS21 family transposase [Candidatus Zhuqueibacterota bacterium]
MNVKQEIILSYYRNGYSIRKISRELGINRKTVTRYLKSYESQQKKITSTGGKPAIELIDDLVKAPRYNSQNRGKRKLSPDIISEVEQLLEQNKQKRQHGQRKQQLKKIDIYELLNDKGFDIGYTSVCNLISELEQSHQEAFIRQNYAAGAVCEFDWGEVKIDTSHGLETYQLAVFTSGYSDYRFARLYKHQDTNSFQQAHVYFFAKINGVFQILVYDNMKVAVKKFVGPTEKEATDGLLKLSMYYQFSFRFCNVRKGNEKGHVERSVEYIRRKAFAKRDHFASLSEANEYLDSVCDSLNARPQKENSNKTAELLLQEEHAYLYPVKPMFECGDEYGLKVDKYSTISYKTCRYSVPDTYVGKLVNCKVYPDRIVCRDENENEPISFHARLNGLHEWSVKIEHYTRTLKKKPGAVSGSLALAQIDSRLDKIYKAYYRNREKQFIELIEYIRDCSIPITKIELAIQHLQAVKATDVTLDKIKILCERQVEQPLVERHGHDEINRMCQDQLKALSRLIPDNGNFSRQRVEVI